LPDLHALPRHGGSAVRRFVQHHSFAQDHARLRHADEDTLTMLGTNQLNLTLNYQPQPLSRRGFMKEIVAPLVSDRRATLEDGRQFIRLYTDALRGIGEGIRVEIHGSHDIQFEQEQTERTE